jgi:transposase-like protein
MKLDLSCPTCGSDDIIKNGTTRRGKQNHKCRDYRLFSSVLYKKELPDYIRLLRLCCSHNTNVTLTGVGIYT